MAPRNHHESSAETSPVTPHLLGKASTTAGQNHTVKLIKTQIPDQHKVS